jgi:hypothetical protein
MRSQSRKVIWGACAAAGVLLVGSLLPVWTTWYLNSWEGVGYPTTLWHAVAQVPANVLEVRSISAFWDVHMGNLIQWAVLQAVATAAGVWGYWLASKQPFPPPDKTLQPTVAASNGFGEFNVTLARPPRLS